MLGMLEGYTVAPIHNSAISAEPPALKSVARNTMVAIRLRTGTKLVVVVVAWIGSGIIVAARGCVHFIGSSNASCCVCGYGNHSKFSL